MFIEKGKEYSSFAGAHVRVITVIGKTKVICGDLRPPGGRVSVPYAEFQNQYTPTFDAQPELPFPQENARSVSPTGRNIEARSVSPTKNAWDVMSDYPEVSR